MQVTRTEIFPKTFSFIVGGAKVKKERFMVRYQSLEVWHTYSGTFSDRAQAKRFAESLEREES